MNKALHILRKDSQQQAIPLAVWLVFLAIRLRLDSLAIESHGNLGTNALMAMFLTFAGFSIVAVLVAAVGADPLGKQEAFFRTRPFRPLEIVFAKILFLTLWITLPIVIVECIYLLLQDTPTSLVVGSIIEKSLIVTLAGIIIGASATTFPSSTAWMRTLLACLPVPWAAAYVLVVWVREFTSSPALTPTHTSAAGFTIQLTLMAVAFSLYAWRSFRKVDSWKRRYAIHALIIATIPLSTIQWQETLFRASGEPLPENTPIEASMDPKRIDVRISDQSPRKDSAQVQVTLKPSLTGPKGRSISWNVPAIELLDDSDQNLREDFRPSSNQLFIFRSNGSNRGKDLSVIADQLPPEVRLIQTFHAQWPPSQTTHTSFSTKKSVVTSEKPTRLRGRLLGRHYSWRKLGELSLQSGATVRDGGQIFRFLGLRPGRGNGFRIAIDWGRPALHLTRDQSLRHHSDNILDQHEFVLIQPEAKIGYIPESAFGQIGNGLLTAYHRSHKTLEYRANNFDLKLPPLNPDSARLLIFKKIYHGDIELNWEKKDIILAKQYSPSGSRILRTAQTISRQEFNRRLADLGPTPLTASRAEAGRYLYQVIKLVQTRDEWIQERDPLARQLAPIAQQHPEMFLAGLKTAEHRASQLLSAVLQYALQEQHLPILLKHLDEQPELADLIVKNGWQESAREALLVLAEHQTNLPISAVRAILLLEEESTYAPLLADFANYPTVQYYEALRTIPSLLEQLDGLVQTLWTNRPRILTHNLSGMQILNIALRHGMQEPLHEIYKILQWIDHEKFSNEYTLSRPIQENVILEGIPLYQRNDSSEVFRWMLQQKPEWFHYDAVRRRFIVKKA